MHNNLRLGLVSGAWLFSLAALGQTPALSPEFQVNTYTTGGQGWASVAPAAGGGFIVIWNSFGQDGDGSGIFGQLFDASGGKLGTEFQVNSYTTGWQLAGAVASDGTGSFVVVWAEWYGARDGSSNGVFARLLDANGSPLGPDFQVNTYTTGAQDTPDVAREANGNFLVVWNSYGQDGDSEGIFAQRFDASGNKLGSEFQVNGYTTGNQSDPHVAIDGSGNFVVEWCCVFARRFDSNGTPLGPEFQVTTNGGDGDVAMNASGEFVIVWDRFPSEFDADVFGRLYDSTGSPIGADFQVNTYTTSYQQYPAVAMDVGGAFTVVWQSFGQDGSSEGIFAQRFDATARRIGTEFQLNTYTTAWQEMPAVMVDASGQFAVAWSSAGEDGSALGTFARRGANNAAQPLMVDGRGTGATSNTNGVFEPGETVMVEPTWKNTWTVPMALSGTASNITGPPGPIYTIDDNSAGYGTVYPGSSNDCYTETQDCYLVTVTGSRPAPHWDATFEEALTDGLSKTWTLHLGASFPDVSLSDPFYKYIENLFHNGVTGGCGGGNYCPTASVTRAQMAVFLLKAKHGSTYLPPPCTGAFGDVVCPGLFTDWIEQLAAESITGGCGGGNYCPNNPVTRAQMSAFLLKAEHGSTYTPPGCGGIFSDVTCPSLFADWIEQLAAEGITGGCGGNNYCPNNPNTRGQMAVFLVKTFGLQLYGP